MVGTGGHRCQAHAAELPHRAEQRLPRLASRRYRHLGARAQRSSASFRRQLEPARALHRRQQITTFPHLQGARRPVPLQPLAHPNHQLRTTHAAAGADYLGDDLKLRLAECSTGTTQTPAVGIHSSPPIREWGKGRLSRRICPAGPREPAANRGTYGSAALIGAAKRCAKACQYQANSFLILNIQVVLKEPHPSRFGSLESRSRLPWKAWHSDEHSSGIRCDKTPLTNVSIEGSSTRNTKCCAVIYYWQRR